MDIRNRKGLRREAVAAVASNPGDTRYTLLIYLAVTAFCSLFNTALSTVLDQQIANTGGLQNLGTQAILATIQIAVPLILSLSIVGLDLGRRGVCMKMARRQAVEPRDLLMGFPHFGALLRATILFTVMAYVLAVAAAIVGFTIFIVSPLSNDMLATLANVNMTSEELFNAIYYDNAFLMQMLPAYPIVGVIFLSLIAPLFYRFRMTHYCLLEGYRTGALKAMGESLRMTKGHAFALFKLDLSFWWFYLAQAFCFVLMYGDKILSLLGVSLPWNATTGYFIFYIAALALECALYWFTLNHVQTTYALAFDAIRPRPQPTQGGVVLGNIFDLAREQDK